MCLQKRDLGDQNYTFLISKFFPGLNYPLNSESKIRCIYKICMKRLISRLERKKRCKEKGEGMKKLNDSIILTFNYKLHLF